MDLVAQEKFDGLCDVVTAIAFAAVPMERIPDLIEDLGRLHHHMPGASKQRLMMHLFLQDRIQRTFNDAVRDSLKE